jgi:hypothetical protein
MRKILRDDQSYATQPVVSQSMRRPVRHIDNVLGLMEMENELRKHIIALLELMIKHARTAGLTEERLSEAEQNLGLSREVMKEAIQYLEERGLAKPTFSDPKLVVGVVCVIALVYVIVSPRIWRERAQPAENSWVAKVRRKFTRRA